MIAQAISALPATIRTSSPSPTPPTKTVEVLDQFTQQGGQVFEDHGFFHLPFQPRFTAVNNQRAAQLFLDGKDGNLVAQAKGEETIFNLDRPDDLAALQTVYLSADPRLAEDPAAALSVHNLREGSYTFQHDHAPIAAKTAYDHFAHNIFGSQYVEVTGPQGRETHWKTRDIGIMDYFVGAHDPRTLERPEVAQMVESWANDGLNHFLATPRRRYEDFIGGRTDQFRLHGVELSKSSIPLDSQDLQAAHDRAMQLKPLIEDTMQPEIEAKRLNSETTQEIYDKVFQSPITSTSVAERWQAYSDLNQGLIKAQGRDVQGWFTVELNRAALDLYSTLAELSPPDQFLQATRKASQTLNQLPDFTPANVIKATIEAAGPNLQQLPEKKQVELLSHLAQTLDHLQTWRQDG